MQNLPQFNVKLTLTKVVNKAIAPICSENVSFDLLLEVFSFLLKINNTLKYDTSSERDFISSQAKGIIINSLKDYQEIVLSCQRLISAESAGLFIELTKEILGMQGIE